MRSLFCTIFLFVAVVQGSELRWNTTSSSHADSVLSSNTLALVAYIIPWTGPSASLLPHWADLSWSLNVPLITVDCSIEKKYCSDRSVHSYPAIRLHKGAEEFVRYRGPPKASDISSFVRLAKLPIVAELDSGNIEGYRNLGINLLVASLEEEDKASRRTFEQVAKEYHDEFIFGVIGSQYFVGNGLSAPGIVIFKADGAETEFFRGPFDKASIRKFILQASRPLIGELTRRTEMGYMTSQKLLAYIFYDNDSDRTTLSRELQLLARKYSDYINFVTIDADEYGHMAGSLGLRSGTFPALTFYSAWKDQVFPYPEIQDITTILVEIFMLDIFQGKVKPIEKESPGSDSMGHDEL
ncbi:hypothetical protein M501DRAFT_1056886 [Patellaria atrata CBS 101060]|uniref:Protein disulfide-isomerase n=1 Tax=Patellaria atrata CBS 101060 TaxID=1346257 RepID=A0A9P4SBC7_9PEZI|nr:hypothetical protein M501DRAFT_1056886 [Patellaria atrata CBS 101060]